MAQRTFKVADECGGCQRKDECRITGIPRDEVYQSLSNAKLYSFVHCAEAGIYEGNIFMLVTEEIK